MKPPTGNIRDSYYFLTATNFSSAQAVSISQSPTRGRYLRGSLEVETFTLDIMFIVSTSDREICPWGLWKIAPLNKTYHVN